MQDDYCMLKRVRLALDTFCCATSTKINWHKLVGFFTNPRATSQWGIHLSFSGYPRDRRSSTYTLSRGGECLASLCWIFTIAPSVHPRTSFLQSLVSVRHHLRWSLTQVPPSIQKMITSSPSSESLVPNTRGRQLGERSHVP